MTKSAAFTSWFAGSKVVDDHGEPKPVYHGTGRDFKKFYTKPGETIEGAAFFTEHPEVASEFANTAGESDEDATPAVYRVHLSVKNPMVLNHTDVMQYHENSKTWIHSFDKMRAVVSKARELGHDGLHIKNVPEHPGAR